MLSIVVRNRTKDKEIEGRSMASLMSLFEAKVWFKVHVSAKLTVGRLWKFCNEIIWVRNDISQNSFSNGVFLLRMLYQAVQ